MVGIFVTDYWGIYVGYASRATLWFNNALRDVGY